jgi:predicted transcriptional regulator
MRTVTVEVSSLQDVKRRTREAFAGKKQGTRISFASWKLLHDVFTDKRVTIINKMRGAGALSIREVARRADRDVKAVHGDVQALLKAGILEKTDDGGVVFPFDAVHIDVKLHT